MTTRTRPIKRKLLNPGKVPPKGKGMLVTPSRRRTRRKPGTVEELPEGGSMTTRNSPSQDRVAGSKQGNNPGSPVVSRARQGGRTVPPDASENRAIPPLLLGQAEPGPPWGPDPLLAGLLHENPTTPSKLALEPNTTVPAGTVLNQTNAIIDQQIIAEKIIIEKVNLILRATGDLDTDVVGIPIREKLQRHAEQAATFIKQDQPDYAASRRHADAALRIADACARLVWDRFDQVNAQLTEPQQRPQEQPHPDSQLETTKNLETAKKLLVAGAALALIVADLTTTGGMITLAWLSYTAGRTLTLQRSTAVCSVCGGALAKG